MKKVMPYFLLFCCMFIGSIAYAGDEVGSVIDYGNVVDKHERTQEDNRDTDQSQSSQHKAFVIQGPNLAPDGTYVGGKPELAPDGTYVGGEPNRAPDGSYVGGKPQLAPDGTYVGGTPNLAPDGTYVGGKPILAPDGTYVGDGSTDK